MNSITTENFIPQKLESVLVENQIISESQLNWARMKKNETGQKIEEILLESEIIDEKALLIVYSIQYGLPVFDDIIRLSDEVVSLVPREMYEEYCFLPLGIDEEEISILISSPLNMELMQDISSRTKKTVKPFLIEKTKLLREIKKLKSSPLSVGHSSIQLLDRIILEAYKEQASDIHFEFIDESLQIKYRIHGDLRVVQDLDKQTAELLLTRLKIMANLDITETQIPQEGQFSVQASGKDLNCRCSIIPAYYGENAVIRILNMPDFNFSMTNLGMNDDQLSMYKSVLDNASGLVLVSGPTGSGKTTTLYSTLQYLSDRFPQKKIVTIEEPIEHPLKGVTQTQITYVKGEDPRFTFAGGLKALLRHDPDIMMIGEIRDSESAMISVNAAITGHLVLATIHASNVFEVISRLLFLGVPPTLFIEGIRMIMTQCLYKKLCQECKHAIRINNKEIQVAYEATGCPACKKQGFTSRSGAFEVLSISDSVKDAVVEGILPSKLKEIALSEGYVDMCDILGSRVTAGEIGYTEYMRLIGGKRVLSKKQG